MANHKVHQQISALTNTPTLNAHPAEELAARLQQLCEPIVAKEPLKPTSSKTSVFSFRRDETYYQ